MTALDQNTVVVAGERKLSSELGAETVILDAAAGEYWSMSPVSGRIWELIQEPQPLHYIVSVLLDEYDVAPQRCEEEVKAVLAQMQEYGLIEVRTPQQPVSRAAASNDS